MAATKSIMLELGSKAPAFELIDTNQELRSLADLAGDEGTLVMFICNHCPYVKHLNSKFVELANEYQKKGINWIAISSNDVENYPQDSPELMKKLAEEEGFPFPYLYDENQEVAKAYKAACTPDLFLFDKSLKLYYRGQFDSSRPGNDIPVTGNDLEKAMQNLLESKPAPEPQIPSIGCNIKWKPGNEPAYFQK
ncbi:thioredoxin family protein [Balneola vulgaris]|jgi:peroxiredoxin|uniref:thioredoxin family protein n=1 Tax=Balneola vulgaris TaxID=287535 RepID=UPI00039DDA83|nr:thioredoxin family protein [Balneola vulgaris]